MKLFSICMIFLSSILICGCATRHITIRTFPPAVADVFLNNKLSCKTSEKGIADISIPSESIFARSVIDIRKDDYCGTVVLDYTPSFSQGHNVAGLKSWGNSSSRFYDVTFSVMGDPLPLYSKKIRRGKGILDVANSGDNLIIAGIRLGENGINFALLGKATEQIGLADGEYDIFYTASDNPDVINKIEKVSVLKSIRQKIELPSINAKIFKDWSK